jgi:hypothetical protein
MKKYSIILSYTESKNYTLIMKSFLLVDGVETDVKGIVLENLSEQVAFEKINEFKNG